MVPEQLKTRIAIIGSGTAGLFAALSLPETADVLLLTKDRVEDANSWFAQGGIATVWSSEDRPEFHLEDTLVAGAGLCDRNAVEVLVKEGPDRVKDLVDFGTEFDRAEGKILLTMEGAHRCRRILHAHGDGTGRGIQEALIRNVRSRPNIRILENFHLADLVVREGTVIGLTGHSGPERARVAVIAGAVVLATGGMGSLYPQSTNPPQATGDGVVAAWRAGAELCDMEFLQFHPTALSKEGFPCFLLSEALRGEGAFLVNEKGERFMNRYHPLGELAPRDVVARAEIAEMESDEKGRVFLDARHLGREFLAKRFPGIQAGLSAAGLSLADHRIPVAPAAHYTIGGVLTDLEGRTSLEGLFAAGEVAATGVHGANRLASNSLLECIVFGRRAAFSALDHVERSGVPTAPRAFESWDFADEWDSLVARDFLKNCLGVIRTAEGLDRAWSVMSPGISNPIPNDFMGMTPDRVRHRNLRQLVGLMARFAFNRRESRGTHFRRDFPKPDPSWAVRQVLSGQTFSRKALP